MRGLVTLLAVLLVGGCGAVSDRSAAVPIDGTPAVRPAAITIEAIGVESTLIPLGLNQDGTLAVPPVDDPMQAAWYDRSPTPGSPGPAVITGHVDGLQNGRKGSPGVFHDLGRLQRGDAIRIDRVDGTVVTFEVTRVEQADKDAFPTATVYGNVPDPELRLITCSGPFDHARGRYKDNTIVYAVVM